MTPGLRAELERLVSLLVDDALDEAEHARLEALLRSDESCRRFYLEYVDLHVRLTQHPRLAALLEGGSVREPAAPKLTLTDRLRERWVPYALTAMMTLAASLVAQLFLSGPEEPNPALPISTVAQTSMPLYVATLSKGADCVWEADEPLRTGMRLLPGVVHLRSGKAELQFDAGGQLVLQGPAKLEVESRTSATVFSGNVLFRSDDSAEPFDLHTPLARLVDYGTEYAVSVTSLGEEVHVFDGEVLRTSKLAPALEPQSVLAGEARRFQSSGDAAGSAVPLDAERLRLRAERPAAGNPVGGAAGELWAYEPFACDAPAIPCSGGGKGGIGFASPWIKSCKSECAIEFQVVNSLWRPQMTSATQGGGVSAACRGAMSRRLKRPLRMDEDGVYYFSCLVRSERRSSAEPCDVQISLRDQRVHEPQRKLAVSASWSASKASLCWEGGGNCASFPVEPGKTYLLAGKIVAGREVPDQAFMRLFAPRQSVPDAEPESWTIASRPVLSDAKFDVVQISANTTTPVLIDELRLGTSWSAVAGVYAER